MGPPCDRAIGPLLLSCPLFSSFAVKRGVRSRRSRCRWRRLSLQHLGERRLLAVVNVSEFDGDTNSERFANAITYAESTEQPDTILLDDGVIDFSDWNAGSVASVHVSTEVILVGSSVEMVSLVGRTGQTLFQVAETGVLRIENVTLVSRSGPLASAILNEGSTQLIGTVVLGDNPPATSEVSHAAILNRGELMVEQTLLANHGGAAILDEGMSQITESFIINNGVGVGSSSADTTLSSTTIIHNGHGLMSLSSKVALHESTIFGNESRMRGAGILVIDSRPISSVVTLDDQTVVIGNDGYGPLDDIFWQSFGDVASDADALAPSAGSLDEAIRRSELLLVDESESSFMVAINGSESALSHSSLTVGQQDATVFVSTATNLFHVALPSVPRWLTIASEDLPDLSGGRVYAGERKFDLTGLLLDNNDSLTAAEWAAWEQITITEARSLEGNAVSLWSNEETGAPGKAPNTWLRYVPREGMTGTDTIEIIGTDLNGVQRTGRIIVDVEVSAGIELQLTAIERGGEIQVSIHQRAGSDVSFYDLTLTYDPDVVAPRTVGSVLVSTNPLVTRDVGLLEAGRMRIEGFGADDSRVLSTIRFERIGPGAGAVQISDGPDFLIGYEGQFLNASAVRLTVLELMPGDVTGDHSVSSLDALRVINAVNRGERSEGIWDPRDVNGDGRLTAVDALRIVNMISSDVEPQSGELLAPIALDAALATWHLEEDDRILNLVANLV